MKWEPLEWTSDGPMTHDIQIQLDGMNCAACASRAEKALQAVNGIGSATVSIADHTARIDLSNAQMTDIRNALQNAGYPARETTLTLAIDGMTCAGCAGRVEKTLAALSGVTEATVNFADRSARISGLSGMVQIDDAIRAIRSAGYSATIPSDEMTDEDPAAAEVAQARWQMIIAAVLTLPVFVLEMGGHLFPMFHHLVYQTIGQDMSWTIQFVLTTLILVGPGAIFLRRGVPNLFKGHPDMNSLVAMGSLAAWGFSTIALFVPGVLPEGTRVVYFEAAAVIVTLILVGRWLEARARGQAGAAIRELARLQPQTALVETANGTRECQIAEVLVGDIVHLRPGERVAVDGVVTGGQSRIDESMITGEPGSVLRKSGDWITAGTINGSGALQYEARRVGSDTVLARIVAMVRQAQGAKLPIQSLADKVVSRFVPAVLVIAALTVLAWVIFGPEPTLVNALVAVVSVLIIACPCAMGLATPTSIMVGTGRAAQLGVLFRKGEALQRLSEACVVAFDKTGTLTEGKPRVTDFVAQDGWSENTVLELVGAAEAQSEHPIARALIDYAESRGAVQGTASGVTAIEGLGLSATVNGQSILVGAPRLMTEQGVDSEGLSDRIDAFQRAGRSVVLASVDGTICAAIGVADAIKPDAAAAIQRLHSMGLKTALITGDSTKAGQVVGDKLGVGHVEAEVLPAGKKAAVDALRATHGDVVFVGDGINDAPALAAADVGIAMGTGTDVAIESADVVLAAGRLSGATTALELSKRTMTNIRQNLFWAFGYNVVLIPVAAGALYPAAGVLLSPILAAGAMALSSVFVVTNALRLRRFQPARDTDQLETKPMATPVAAE